LAHTVLIIEDNLPNLMMAKELLEVAGYQTLEAEEAEKGMALARQYQPDLILMDMHLPICNGYEASRLLKCDPQTQDITIVAFTAMAMEDEKEKALRHGCSGVISKPIDVDHFAETIAGFINTNSAGDQAHPASAPATPPSPIVPALLHPKVLVAANQTAAQALKENLAPITKAVDSVAILDAQRIIQCVSQNNPDVLLLDVTTPGMDDTALLAQLNTNPAVADLPVILISEPNRLPTFLNQLNQGHIEYMTKPFRPEEIQAKVQGVLKLRRMEEQLAQSQESVTQFLSLASHDLQAPLRKISQFGQMLQDSAYQELSPANQELLAIINRSAQQMHELLNDLMLYSRLHQKRGNVAQVSLKDIMAEILVDKKDDIAALSARIELGPMVSLTVDPTQFRQVMTELIDNALKFHQEGVLPVIRIASEITPEQTCKITVEDNGIGFNSRHALRIFKPLERLHAMSRYPGTGMGLALAQKIVEWHGGAIQAQALPGQGACFTILLPC
jgi:signal transduction histidine kinase